MTRRHAQQSTAEQIRLNDADRQGGAWRLWGPYLSERQWGTVREDYSAQGAAWDHFPHDHARSRAYRWGEDGIAGISDDQQRLCFALAMWNGRDPILKERLFGLTGPEGNHGEDVKECYHYLDATPTHSYLKMLYKYPQEEFPYSRLVEENRRRGKTDGEFELVDTGVFDAGRYFDVFVEYAKEGPQDILIRITVHNRGDQPAALHLLPQLWFRNTWSWQETERSRRPVIKRVDQNTVRADHPEMGCYHLHAQDDPQWLFCENQTNVNRLYGAAMTDERYKDAFHEFIVHGNGAALNPHPQGTKAGGLYVLQIPAGESATVRLKLTRDGRAPSWSTLDAVATQRIAEADAFYAWIQRDIDDADKRLVQRQALAGMIWSKQYYAFDVRQWLKGDPGQPQPPRQRRHGRNHDWGHLNNADIISMPDKWEYPWYAAWDLAFHCIPLAMVDAQFAKDQLLLLTREWYMHPNGQLPAYEWAFGDVNPPVHAWAAWKVYEIDRRSRAERGEQAAGDHAFLERLFHKLMLNFTWWVNRKDRQGRNVFEGGFLGLDNIGVFDRSAPLPNGGHLNQADGTSWMAMYCLNMMRIALELAESNPVYQDSATKFFEHFLHVAAAMTNIGGDDDEGGVSLWCQEDEFFYDVLGSPDGGRAPLKVRSMVGLIPLFAVEVLGAELLERVPEFKHRLEWFLEYRPDLAGLVSRWFEQPHCATCKPRETRLLSLLRGHRMKALLRRMLDETEFLSPYGIRALSKAHEAEPYSIDIEGRRFSVGYRPGESDTELFGGNSNWRGPIWMPVNYLLIDSIRQFHGYYGDDFKVECPTGSGRFMTLLEVSEELSRRLMRIFLKDDRGRRAVFGQVELFQNDPHFRDYVPFHEYFHGDNGRGVGASHQTGWTGLIASLIAEEREAAMMPGASALHERDLDLISK